jgi:hypothetical protein
LLHTRYTTCEADRSARDRTGRAGPPQLDQFKSVATNDLEAQQMYQTDAVRPGDSMPNRWTRRLHEPPAELIGRQLGKRLGERAAREIWKILL